MGKKRKQGPADLLGEMLMLARRRAQVSQEELSQELGFVGNSVVTKIEMGERDVLLVEFIHICEFLDEDPAELFQRFLRQIEGMPRKTVREVKREERDK